MTTILAEKPSVARNIARIVGANKREEGYLSGNGYHVTWAIGHLCTLAMPEEYGFENYNADEMPILPDPFKLAVRKTKNGKEYKDDPGAQKQLGVIKKLFAQCENIIVATDAGREGELIFRNIYEYIGCDKPFNRLWISSLTDKSIREGLENLKNGTEYDRLYESAKARSQADWLVGINASRALSIAAGSGVYSLGRVQTPTLAMICKRTDENRYFQPKPYWKIGIETQKNGVTLKVVHTKQYQTHAAAVIAFRTVEACGKRVCIEQIETKTVKEESPLLFDLTSLQKEANKKHGFSADETLQTAQKLYENKFITYPRTGSRYISDDVFEEIPELLSNLQNHTQFGEYARSLQGKPLNKRSVNSLKVTDHHALLPTENVPENISANENIIYNMIVARTLESFSEVFIKERTLAYCIVGNLDAVITGDKPIQRGWKAVLNEKKSVGEEEVTDNLPQLEEGEHLPVTLHEISNHYTKPKPLFTEATLLSAMETAGKDVDDEEARAAMKECGIGTPATRASIIETLLTRNYIIREKKNLIPTDKGQTVYEAVKDKQIADAMMTGTWEAALSQIESGKLLPDTFNKSIRIYAGQITSELLQKSGFSNLIRLCACPVCKQNSVRLYPKIAKCKNEGCGFKIFRTVCGKTLSDDETISVIEKGISPLLKGLKSKASKPFDAKLQLNPDGTTSLQFENNKRKDKK